jgi:hypothetical protein
MILNLILLTISAEIYEKLFSHNFTTLEDYSKFSKFVLLSAVKCFDCCAIVLITAQLIRRKSIQKFLSAINQFEIYENSKNQLKKNYFINLVAIVIFPTIVTLIRNSLIYRTDNIFAYIGWFASFKLNFAIAASFNFYNNFQQFVLVILKEIQVDFQDFEFSNDKLEKTIHKLLKIEYFLEIYEKIFGFQQTVANVTCVFAFVTFVSQIYIIYDRINIKSQELETFG